MREVIFWARNGDNDMKRDFVVFSLILDLLGQLNNRNRKTKKKQYNDHKMFIKNTSFLVKILEFNLPQDWIY